MMRVAIVAIVLIGCGPKPVWLVSDVRIEGYDLVIERCPVTSGDKDRSWDAWRSCQTQRRRLPANVKPGTAAPLATTDYRQIGAAREALAACVTGHALRGVVHVDVSTDVDGQVARVEPAAIEGCVRGALAVDALPARTRLRFAMVVEGSP